MKIRTATRHSRTVKFLRAASLLCGLILPVTQSKLAFSQPLSEGPQIKEALISHESKQQTKAEIPAIVGFRIIYVYEHRATGTAFYERVVMLFEDGTFTRDFDTLIASNSIVTSQQENPRKWGEWRTDSQEGFMYRHSYQDEWRDNTAISSQSVADGYLLEGCYNAQSTANATRSHGRFCFDNNGLFVTGSPSGVTVGMYQIKGNQIGMLYEDETLVVNYFGMYSSGQLITMNGRVFTKED